MAGERVPVAIVGSGNIGTDLLIKLLRDDLIDVRYLIGIDPESDGLRRARELGVETSAEGVDWLLKQSDLPRIVFEATSAAVHQANEPRYREAGIIAVDLTPAAIGPLVVPAVNLSDHLDSPNVNMVTCGGQATIPIVAAVSRVTEVSYGEIVGSISSRSAGPGTRANIDEFTHTTSRAVREVGGAQSGKAIIILNPADPPLLMRCTVYCAVAPEADWSAIEASIHEMVATVDGYVPGYRLIAAPQREDPRPEWGGAARITTMLEIEGRGDYFPPYAGNLDIMTAAAAAVGHDCAVALSQVPA